PGPRPRLRPAPALAGAHAAARRPLLQGGRRPAPPAVARPANWYPKVADTATFGYQFVFDYGFDWARAARSSAIAQPKTTSASPRLWSISPKSAATSAAMVPGFCASKSRQADEPPSPARTNVRSSIWPSAPNRLARRRPQARSSPVAL